MRAALPYHATNEFVRLVRLLRLPPAGPVEFLSPMQASGAALPRALLVQRCITDRVRCGQLRAAFGQPGPCHEPWFTAHESQLVTSRRRRPPPSLRLHQAWLTAAASPVPQALLRFVCDLARRGSEPATASRAAMPLYAALLTELLAEVKQARPMVVLQHDGTLCSGAAALWGARRRGARTTRGRVAAGAPAVASPPFGVVPCRWMRAWWLSCCPTY